MVFHANRAARHIDSDCSEHAFLLCTVPAGIELAAGTWQRKAVLSRGAAADSTRGGLMIAHPQSSPRDLVKIVDLLLPELQRRGRIRTRHEGRTLNENLLS